MTTPLRRADPFAAKGVRRSSDLRRTYSTPRFCDTACALFAAVSAFYRNRVMNDPG